jgi:ubiquinone biosynthesis protein COQ9
MSIDPKEKLEKDTVLQQVIEESAFDGWNDKTLEKASEKAGFKENYCYILFPNGISDVVDSFQDAVSEHMLTEIANSDFKNLKIREKIESLVMARITYFDRNKHSIHQLVKYYATPFHKFQGAQHLAKAADTMWYAAGDKATDLNYYSKRALLSMVYSSSLLYWLGDDSKDSAETRAFVKRRIEDVMKIEKAKFKAKGWAEELKQWIPA